MKRPKPPESKDGVTGPWWVSFEEMLTPEDLEEIGVSADRGAVVCIMRLASAYADLLEHHAELRLKHDVCCCSYDNPGDVCAWHQAMIDRAVAAVGHS